MRVDFYVHSQSSLEALQLTACRLAEKAYLQTNRVFVHTDSEALARTVDERLWTYRDRSFVPHALVSECGAEAAGYPVVIGFGQAPEAHTDVLINLTGEVPAFYARFARVVELVDADEDRRRRGRERFRYYRDQGHTPEIHNL